MVKRFGEEKKAMLLLMMMMMEKIKEIHFNDNHGKCRNQDTAKKKEREGEYHFKKSNDNRMALDDQPFLLIF